MKILSQLLLLSNSKFVYFTTLENFQVMRATSICFGTGTLLSMASATISRRLINDPVGEYLNRMCYPLNSNNTRTLALQLSPYDMISSLVNSPFPCEQEAYIGQICIANGTTEIDFLAEQECLCNGAFWDAFAGCND